MADRRLEELIDTAEINGLITAYCRNIDLNNPDGVAALFADDAVIDYGQSFPPRMVGPAALAAALRESLGNVDATSHHCSNAQIWFDGPDDAHGITYLYAWHRFAGRPDFHLWAQYHDRYRRVPDVGWRFAFRSIRVCGSEGVDDRNFDMIGRHAGRAPEGTDAPQVH